MCKFHKLILGVLSSTAALCALLAGTSHAVTVDSTASFESKITILASCTVVAGTTLDFGSVGLLTSEVTAKSKITVNCNNNTEYKVSLDSDLAMSQAGVGQEIKYGLFEDVSHSTPWVVLAGTGVGSPVDYPVYGRVLPQDTPSVGEYTDTVTVTVTY
jgi:spore coat protein U-like protein